MVDLTILESIVIVLLLGSLLELSEHLEGRT